MSHTFWLYKWRGYLSRRFEIHNWNDHNENERVFVYVCVYIPSLVCWMVIVFHSIWSLTSIQILSSYRCLQARPWLPIRSHRHIIRRQHTKKMMWHCPNDTVGNHIKTLQKLYAWERKLYDEVKVVCPVYSLSTIKCEALTFTK